MHTHMQGLYKAHRNTPRIVIKEGHEANRETYFANMCGSKFCVVASGFGFSTRALEAAAAGCVPLLMQDGVSQFYEDILPWDKFSLRLNNSLGAISTLPKMLAAVPDETVSALRRTLYCAWPRLLWLRESTPLPSAERLLKFDAFEMLMWTLRKRLRGESWTRPPDWDEGCSEVRRYFEQRPRGLNPRVEWKPWQNHDLGRPTTTS